MRPINDSFSTGIRVLLFGHLGYVVVCALFALLVFALEKFGLASVADGGVLGVALFIMVVAPGIVGQLLYVLPMSLYFAAKKQKQVIKGVLVGALVTGFINVGAMILAAYMGVALSPETKPPAREKITIAPG